MSDITNPLLIGKGLPPFPDIQAEHVIPAITELLEVTSSKLKDLEANLQPSWLGLVEPLERITEPLGWAWGAIEHLLSVKNSPELREAHKTIQPKVIEFFNQFSQSQPIYKAYKAIYASEQWRSLDPAQQRIVEAAIRDAELSGVGLEGEAKEKFNAIQMELAELSTNFSNHVLDATKAFSMTLTKPDEIAGLPPSLLALAAQAAKLDGDATATPEKGPWCITLDYPSYVPFMQHSQRPDLREKLYRAFVSRAAQGELDNSPLIERILELRQQKANLLGYSTYAELSLARKMAPNVEAVEKLLEELRQVSYTAAQSEFAELQEFAKSQGVTTELKHWDISYWAERQRESKFNFTVEELRPYFSLPQVLEGLFALVQRLFGVTVVLADGQAPVWHEDVRFFEIRNEQGQAIANFYLDPYSRPSEKRGGAWMNDCVGRAKLIENDKPFTRLPVAYLICNQSPPVGDQPSLMTFGEVETLFHEFGHGLQHMLTQVDYSGASGINNVEWDAVELPSQFMENWCYDRATLFGMAKHYATGETLPESYYQKLIDSKNYMSGSGMLRQIHFSLVDIALHHYYQAGGDETPSQLRSRLAQTTMIMPPLPEDNFLCSFGHIFAGGYAAGYYSYKWAEVLSADAFAAFEEAGLENEEAITNIGRRYRDTVLALGGSRHPMEVFKSFRGREPSTKPLLRHSGLIKV
ncbi:MAG: M3 family metallopeptidase [Pseudanabaenaceae cyanobacterium bins.39]|nr:M3 family metallopeptidase [Pseudanabaenaceae cyanobacterium bins.39]